MIEIIQKLDEITEELYPESSSFKKKLWGYCELAKRSSQGDNSIGEQPLVITINGTSDRQYVTLDDRYDFISWMRTPSPITLQNTIAGSDWGFGFDEGQVQKLTIRWVIAHKVEYGEMLIFNLVRQLPARINIPGYGFVSIDKTNVSIDPDHEAIYQTELGNTVYEKHRTTWNLYVINTPVEYILDPDCKGSQCCSNSILEEDNDCLILE